ncbi:gamma-butyrobetaine hydroxylase-like domain-containing protein [Thiospirillum jenense]|uniref:DUF971 domain-containing protein n=1 Tax=Thiospirillum jenense TaxID=1653858 RepID=A0A839HFD7_9GAMM|nr:gamma-butyrobetaine hydroxylase-like domain-containing protein [Thiospirillum jenense]MBB1125877.1 DUF971 domain-containing protein [Thiospirillum jenense]
MTADSVSYPHLPSELQLHSKSRVLTICFNDGACFHLPCEYLRVFSPAAAHIAGIPIVGKELVNITAIEPQGQYAVRLCFDDGDDTGIYAWETLYALGMQYEENWAQYLTQLKQCGYQRQEPAPGNKHLQLLYFSWLAKKMRKTAEEVIAPATVVDVNSLLTWLGQRRRGMTPLFQPGQLRVTVNKQFTEPFTRLQDGDEIGLVPMTPIEPQTPELI